MESNSKSLSEFLDPIKDALNRMQEGEEFSRESFELRTTSLISTRFGERQDDFNTGFAFGSVGIQADHSHYFDGFALLKRMRHGTSVSIRKADRESTEIAVEGAPDVYKYESTARLDDSHPLAIRFIQAVLKRLPGGHENGLDLAVVSTIPPSLESSYLAALGASLLLAFDRMTGSPQSGPDRIHIIQSAVESVLGYPFGFAYIVSAFAEPSYDFLLVDTQTLEYLPVKHSGMTGPGWALVDTCADTSPEERIARQSRSDNILSKLRNKQFSGLDSLRDLEHRDLETALHLLPRKLRPGLRHLVTENRRVQRLVAAIRNEDWQLMGALLLMSHASRRTDWDITSAIQNFVVDEAERFSIEGVYGATQTGEGSFVLIAGQPVRLPFFLDHLRINWPETAIAAPETFII